MDKSLLAKLPLELRDKIYMLCFRSTRPLAMIRTQGTYKTSDPIPGLTSLLKTCRQMHAECAPLLYAGNVFEFTQTGVDESPVVKFLHLIGNHNAQALRKLVVSTSDLPELGRCYMITKRNIDSARVQFFDLPEGMLSEGCELVLKGTFLYLDWKHRPAVIHYELSLTDLGEAWWEVAKVVHGVWNLVCFRERRELEGQIRRLAKAASASPAGESVLDQFGY